MNPCQGHILELKLAAIQALDYQDFWMMFGEGRHPDFDRLLTSKLSPFLSSSVVCSATWRFMLRVATPMPTGRRTLLSSLATFTSAVTLDGPCD